MALDPSNDLASALYEMGDPVTLLGGGIVYAISSIATTEDGLDGDSIVPGKTKVLRFATTDVPSVVAGQNLTWQAKTYRVVKIQLGSMGHITRAFLGSA